MSAPKADASPTYSKAGDKYLVIWPNGPTYRCDLETAHRSINAKRRALDDAMQNGWVSQAALLEIKIAEIRKAWEL